MLFIDTDGSVTFMLVECFFFIPLIVALAIVCIGALTACGWFYGTRELKKQIQHCFLNAY